MTHAFPASIAYSLIESAAALVGGPMASSAALALADARNLWDEGKRYDYAAGRALASIAYSVGKFSDAYRNAALAFEDGYCAV